MSKATIHAIVKYMIFLKKLSGIVLVLFVSTAYASDGRTMTDKLTCYNYEKRIVFILDLEKDNEKLNNMNLAVVKRTKDSIELVAPDLLVKFDSHNFIMNIIPTRATEALTMDCTTY